MDDRIGSGLYQSCGNRGSVGRVSVFWLRWCGWCTKNQFIFNNKNIETQQYHSTHTSGWRALSKLHDTMFVMSRRVRRRSPPLCINMRSRRGSRSTGKRRCSLGGSARSV